MSDQKQVVPNEEESRSIRTRYYTLSYYQHQAARTLIDKPDFVLTEEEQMILWNADGLAGEVGEIMNTVKKAIWHRKGVDLLKGEEFKKELGDALWYLACLCTKLGFELGDVGYTNIEKLLERFPDGYDQSKTPDIDFYVHVDPAEDESKTVYQNIYYQGDLQVIIDEPDNLHMRFVDNTYVDQHGRVFSLEKMDKILTAKEQKAVDPEGMLGANFRDPGLDMRSEETKRKDREDREMNEQRGDQEVFYDLDEGE